MAFSSPLDLETQYQRLLDVLEGPVSDRWALVQAGLFLERLTPDQPETESYLLPLGDPLADRAGALDPVGLSPGRLVRLVEMLCAAKEAHPTLRENDALRRAETALRRRAGLLYGYAGAVERAVACMNPSCDAEGLTGLSEGAPRDRLRAARAMGQGGEAEQALRWVWEHWERADEDREGAAVPVVERLPSWARPEGRDLRAVGALRRLYVELYGPAEEADQLRVDVTVHGAEDHDPVQAPVRAARELLDRQFSGLEGQYLQGRLVFDRDHRTHEGQSAGLAIAALFYGAALRHTRQRRRLQVRSEAALTGDVNPDGSVQPVADESLRAKVRTTFFSPKNCLVVPDAQQAAAESARDDLLDAFPHGKLGIVGVDRLDALFYDRRLTRLERVGRIRHTAQRLWDRRGRVAMGTLIAALLLVIAALLYGPLDKNPVAVTFGGSQMQLRNESGQIVDRISVGTKVVERVHNQGDPYSAYSLYDITTDGQNEVCWAQRTYKDPEAPSFVACQAVGAETLSWRRPLQVDFSFPEKPAVQSGAFAPVGLLAGDLDDNGRPEVYLTAKHQPYFPTIVVQYDGITGEKKRRYIHAGHLSSKPLALDLDQNGGVKEILIGGTSNAYGQGVLAVLDPRTMDGHGPMTSEYRLAHAQPATERAYLRFPYTPVGRIRQTTHPMVKQVWHRSASGRIRLEILEGTYGDEREVDRPYVLVHLNYALRAKTVGTSSQYDYLADSLVASGRLDAVPDGDDFSTYRDQIQYWTGSGWTTEPSMNERWRDVVKAE